MEFYGDMGEAIHNFVKAHGYTVVQDIGGHGVGLEFHEEPFVSYVTRKGTEMVLVPGMVFTIEPMVNMGTVKYLLMRLMIGRYIRMIICRRHSGK